MVGVIDEQMLPHGVWNMRNIELVPVQVKVADLRMTHVQDSQRVSHICASPQFAEPWAGGRQFSDQLLHARIIQICARAFP